MNTWVRKTKRESTCSYCGRPIEVGTWQIICTYFMPLKSGKTWTMRMVFHAEPVNCWLERAKAEIESRPTIENRGRKALELSDDKREMRGKLLRRRTSVMQRLDVEMQERKRSDKLIHLTEELEKIKEQIMEYGGAPKGW